MTKYFLGIDVGSTKSHALLADETGRAVGFGKGGPGNHEGVGYDGLIAVMNEATEEAVRMAGIRKEEIAGAGFGIAGYDWPSERQPTLDAIATLGLSCPVEAVNDTVIGLISGASQGWGVAVVAGTGNNCWGRDQKGRQGHVTGNGGLFGEHGGGSDLVWAAFSKVVAEWSRRGKPTQLTQMFIEVTGATDIENLIEGVVLEWYYIYSGLAPRVFQVAEQGDEVARETLAWMGGELASLAIGVIRQLGFERMDFEVVLVGSLYKGGSLLIEPMRRAIQAEAPGARLVRLEGPPVIGGVLLGFEQAGLNPYSLRKVLIQSARELVGE